MKFMENLKKLRKHCYEDATAIAYALSDYIAK